MNKRLEVGFLDDQNQTHFINFLIFNSDLANRWASLVVNGVNDPLKNIHSSLSNASAKSIPKIYDKLNTTIDNINNRSQFNLSKYERLEDLNSQKLNVLNEKFELYGTQIENLHNDFIELNELIHTCEDILKKTSPYTLPVMHCQFDFYPQTEFSPILEKDKLFLETEFKWGEIYLGYNTLGKDWLKVCLDNDIDVITRNMVKPQKRFAAETFINFGPDCVNHDVQKKFTAWYNGLPEELQKKVPIDNLNELCLGRFVVGKILIDGYFLKYNSDLNAWNSSNSNAKRKWNDEVFTTFTKIISVQIK
jgi:hypothetical protein